MAYQSFEELDVRKRACLLAVRVYGLRDQMQRIAVSIASNIAAKLGLFSSDELHAIIQELKTIA